MSNARVLDYFQNLNDAIINTEVRDADAKSLSLAGAIDDVIAQCQSAHASGNKVIFTGNGGCAGFCSHMATDFNKIGGIRALALNDSSALTCLGNDYGFEFIFSKQIEYIGAPGDVLIALSASGRSADILNGVASAKALGIKVITFSGFTPDNPLKSLGGMNFYIDSPEYGFVETGFQALLHCILDLAMGWKG